MPNHTCRNLKRTEFIVSGYTEITPAALSLEDLLLTDYWIHILPELRVHDLVTVINEGGLFEATLRVMRLGPGFIEFRVVTEWRAANDDAGDGTLEIGWTGPAKGWFVRQIANGKKLASGLDKSEARKELLKLCSKRAA